MGSSKSCRFSHPILIQMMRVPALLLTIQESGKMQKNQGAASADRFGFSGGRQASEGNQIEAAVVLDGHQGVSLDLA